MAGPRVVDLSQLDRHVEDAAAAVQSSGRVWVVGAAGTGRTTVAHRLAEVLEGAHLVSLPDLGPEAPLHGLLQAVAPSDLSLRNDMLEEREPLQQRARVAAQALADAGRALVLRVPFSWDLDRDPRRDVRGEDATGQLRQAARRSAIELLTGLMSVQTLRLVVVTSRAYQRSRLPWQHQRLRLAPLLARWRCLEEGDSWGELAPEAAALARAVGHVGPEGSPISLRLGVGAAALGVPAQEVVDCWRSGQRRDLVAMVDARIGHTSELRRGLQRFLLERFGLSREQVARLTGASERVLAVLTECLGYGDDQVRVSEPVRARLARHMPRTQRAAGHETLAELHEELDGVGIASAGPGAILHTLERLHHLGRGGPNTAEAWEAEVPPAKAFLMDRARSLSRYYGRYADAARLYQRCTELDSHDAYAWHYLAWNRQKLRRFDSPTDEAYARAVALDPDNPWWNSRYVSFLIHGSRFGTARRQWEAVRARFDASRGEDPDCRWMARHVHRWVAKEWLDRGCPDDALAVLSEIEPGIRTTDPSLAELWRRAQDERDAAALRESVYPSSFPLLQRWQPPAVLPGRRDGEPLIGWFPGRVADTGTDRGVRIVFATPEAESRDRRVLERWLTPDEWEAAAGLPWTDARGFYFLGTYGEPGDPSLYIVPMQPGSGRDGELPAAK